MEFSRPPNNTGPPSHLLHFHSKFLSSTLQLASTTHRPRIHSRASLAFTSRPAQTHPRMLTPEASYLTKSTHSPRTSVTSSSSAQWMDTERTSSQEELGELNSTSSIHKIPPILPLWLHFPATKHASKQPMLYQMPSSSSSPTCASHQVGAPPAHSTCPAIDQAILKASSRHYIDPPTSLTPSMAQSPELPYHISNLMEFQR